MIQQAKAPKQKLTGQAAFLRERARYLLAHQWCVDAANNEGVVRNFPLPGEDDFLAWTTAIDAGWVTGEKGNNPYGFIKSLGWKYATSFLKR